MANGVIAAGHQCTAHAGARILAEGGNAVDAAVAAAFASCVAEPTLTGLGSGGYMLIHDAAAGAQTLLDFFMAMPGLDLPAQRVLAPMHPAPVDFGDTVQLFHAGHASVAVPGMIAGLFTAHERFGSLPMTVLLEPAAELARSGVVQTEQHAYLNRILSNILHFSDEARAMWEPEGRPLVEGEVLHMPDMAATFEQLGAEGAGAFYRGDLGRRMIDELAAGGSAMTMADLFAYRTVDRAPVRVAYRGRTVVTNSPPSTGGPLIAYALALLGGVDLGELGFHSTAHVLHLAAVMSATVDVRRERYDEHRHDDDVLDRLLAAEVLAADRGRFRQRLGNTTHLSVVDHAGSAVTLTSSAGSCSGVCVAGTGIHLNNILGEGDLNPSGLSTPPGARLTSMMSPTLVLDDRGPQLVIGSAGSSRIRSAILQVVSAVIDFGMSVPAAIDAPRLHVEPGHIDLEPSTAPGVDAALLAAGYAVTRWTKPNLYFGGTQAVGRGADGIWQGAGDPRRGGVAIQA